MAKITKLVDDLDGETEAEMTLTFGLDGKEYEIDLHDENYEKYYAILELLASAGRRVVPVHNKVVSKTQGRTREELVMIREWARANGHKVSEFGRIAESIIEAFEAATAPKAESEEVKTNAGE
jgi:hypothetical protein